jgi:hypothetical protein
MLEQSLVAGVSVLLDIRIYLGMANAILWLGFSAGIIKPATRIINNGTRID